MSDSRCMVCMSYMRIHNKIENKFDFKIFWTQSEGVGLVHYFFVYEMLQSFGLISF